MPAPTPLIDGELPAEFFIGKMTSEWPLFTFTSEVQVIAWLQEPKSERKRVWKVSLTSKNTTEMKLIPPGKPQLVPKGQNCSR